MGIKPGGYRITIGEKGITVLGDTTTYDDDIAPSNACTGFDLSGPDEIYVVTVPAGGTINASVIPDGWDAAIYVTAVCGASPACLVGSDFGLEGASEGLSVTVDDPGEYYVVVDGWDLGIAGAYSLRVVVF